MAEARWQALAPEDAIAFFRAKGVAIGFNWRDVWEEEHAVAFTVAKAMTVDLLDEIRAAIDQALADGETLAQFQEQLSPRLQARGWWGRREVIDPLTGEVMEATLGSWARLRTIYDTNLRTAYAAGHWQRIERTADARPWLQYRHTPQEHPREEHQAWDGLVLRWDDPWWREHFPPNGWYCKCRAVQMSDRQIEARGLTPEKAPPDIRKTWVDRRNNRVVVVPHGVDPGFATNPGRSDRRAEATERLKEKATLLERALGLAAGALVRRLAGG